MSIGEKIAAFLAVAIVLVAVCGAVVWNMSLPIVQLDSVTKEKVAVITSDGTVHPPSYLEEAKVKYYTPEYVASGYKPAKFGVKEWELHALK